MSVPLLILGLILFVGLVVVHEFGHFIVARRNGVEVEEFGIGFPPRIWGRKTKSGFIFTINWLPLGGFVKLKGESDSSTEKGSLGAATTWVKTKIMLAGVTMNVIVAFFLLTILAVIGLPEYVPNQFTVKKDAHIVKTEVLAGYVDAGSPAKHAGLESTDVLRTIGTASSTSKVTSSATLSAITDKYAGEKVTITYDRGGAERKATVTLLSQAAVNASKHSSSPKGHLGVIPVDYNITRYTWAAPVVALGLIKQVTVLTFQALGSAVAALMQGQGHNATQNLSGPVGIFVQLKDGTLLGYQFILMFIAIISLSLAIMNVLPVPALDGGRLYMVLLSRLFKKELSQEMEERIVGASFVFLLFIIALITIVDVKRFL